MNAPTNTRAKPAPTTPAIPPEPEFPSTPEPEYLPAEPIPPAPTAAKPSAAAAVEMTPRFWTEAPCVAFAPVYKVHPTDPERYAQYNVTMRAGSWKQAIDDLMQAVKYAGETYGTTPYKPTGRAAPSQVPGQAVSAPANAPIPATFNAGGNAPAIPAAPAVPANGQRPPATPATPANNPANSAGGQQIFHVNRFDVELRQDGRVKLNWFEPGHKFADIYKVCTPEVAAQILSATGDWQPEHFAIAATYNVNWQIYWRPSANTTAKGNPYKDIVSITPA